MAVAGTEQQMPTCGQVSNCLNATYGNCLKAWAHKQEDAATNEFAVLGSLETVPMGGGSLPEVGVSLAEVRTPGYVRCSGDAGAWGTPRYVRQGTLSEGRKGYVPWGTPGTPQEALLRPVQGPGAVASVQHASSNGVRCGFALRTPASLGG